MAKKAVAKGIYKTLERVAHETRYGIDSLYFSFDLSKKFGKQKAHVLSGMPQSTMTELVALRDDLNKLFRSIARRAKNSN